MLESKISFFPPYWNQVLTIFIFTLIVIATIILITIYLVRKELKNEKK